MRRGVSRLSDSQLRACFEQYFESIGTTIQDSLRIQPFDNLNSREPAAQDSLPIQPFDKLNAWEPAAPCLYLIGEKSTPDLPQNTLILSQKLRDTLAAPGNVYENKAGFSLNQASIINLTSERYDQSALLAGYSGYEEYLLWNDGGLWGQAEWNARLAEQSALGDRAALRLVWLGAGWLCSRLAERLAGNNDPWFYEPDIEAWAERAMDNLMQFDTALIDYYRAEKNSEPPGRRPGITTYARYAIFCLTIIQGVTARASLSPAIA